MNHFSEQILKENLAKIQNRQAYLLDKVGTDFKVLYYHFPLNSSDDYFEIFGILKPNNFSKVLCKCKTIDEVITKIKEFYPKMKPEDWEIYTDLSLKAEDASTIRSISNNKVTRKKEDEAIKEFCSFCKKHDLYY